MSSTTNTKIQTGEKKWKKILRTYFKEGLSDTGHCILENWIAQAQLSSQTYNEPEWQYIRAHLPQSTSKMGQLSSN